MQRTFKLSKVKAGRVKVKLVQNNEVHPPWIENATFIGRDKKFQIG